MTSDLIAQGTARLLRNGVAVKRIIHTAIILWDGWEMDSRAWIVEMEDGTQRVLSTNHGSVFDWTREEAEDKLRETEESAASIRKALELWPPRPQTAKDPTL